MTLSRDDFRIDPQRPILFECPKCKGPGEPARSVMVNYKRELVPVVNGYCWKCDFTWRALPGRNVLLMRYKPERVKV